MLTGTLDVDVGASVTVLEETISPEVELGNPRLQPERDRIVKQTTWESSVSKSIGEQGVIVVQIVVRIHG